MGLMRVVESPSAVAVEDLLVRAGAFALEVDRLEAGGGEYLVVMGPTGSGKTVLLETVAGFRRPERGRVLVGGRDVTDLPPEGRNVSLVPQDRALWPHMTVLENIAYGLRARGVPRGEARARAAELAEAVGVSHLLDRRPRTLSGGEQQRVALARALAVGPAAVLLDEPLSSLDSGTRERVRGLLERLHSEMGFTAIHVTHDPVEAAELGDRVAVLIRGRLVQVGRPAEVFGDPATEEVALLGGRPVLLEGVAVGSSGGLVRASVGGVEVLAVGRCPPGSRVTLITRPEDVVILRTRPASSEASPRNCLECVVTAISERGALMVLELDCGGPRLESLVTRGAAEQMGLGEGSRVYASVKASAVRVLRCRPAPGR